MARESLSAHVEYEKTDFGVVLYRRDDEEIKLCSHEVEKLAEIV